MEPAPQRTRLLRPYLLWGGWIVASLVLLLGIAQVTFPFWLTQLTPLIAKRLDLEQLTVTAGRPGWHGINIAQLVAVSDEYRVEARGLHVAYSWPGLRHLGMDRIDAEQLDITVNSPYAKSDKALAKPPVIADLPLKALAVRTLILRFPETGFVGRGEVSLGDDGLRLLMDGETPAAASVMRVRASLTRAGEFNVRVGERERQGAHFLTLTGTLLDDSITVLGAVDLSGFPLRLASEMVGAPQGTGRVVGAFDTTMPWPLPSKLDWRSLVVNVSEVTLDWAADSFQMALRQIKGEAVFDQGRLRASLGGDFLFTAGERTLSARLAPESVLLFDHNTLRGTTGLSLRVAWDEVQIEADVTSFSLLTQAAKQLKVTTRLAVSQAGRTDVRNFDIDASLSPPADVGGYAQQIFTANVRLSSPESSPEFARMEGVWTADSVSANGRIDLADEALGFVSTVTGAPAGAGRLRAEFDGVLSNMSSIESAEIALDVSSLALDWTSADQRLTVAGLKGTAQIKGAAFEAALSGAVKLRLDDRQVSVRLPPGYPLSWSNDVLRGGAGVTISSAHDDQELDMSLREFALRSGARPRLDLDADVDARIDTSHAVGRMNGRVVLNDRRKQAAVGRFTFDGKIDAAGQMRDGKLESEFALKQDTLAAQGSVTTSGIGRVPFDLTLNTATLAGRLAIDQQFEFFEPAASLFIPDWTAAYDLDSGKVGVAIVMQLVSALPAATVIKLAVNDGAAHYSDYVFTGINGHLELMTKDLMSDAPWRVRPTGLHIASIDMGLTLSDAIVDIALEDQQLDVTRAEAALLGGRVSTTPFAFGIDSGTTAFDVALENLDLAQVLALEGDDISGTGRLDGDLPISFADFVPTVAQGRVRARPPGGTIAVSPRLAETGGQAELSFALRALSDLRYDKLDATVDYAANGDLDLGVTLQGRNPLVEKDRPIHYNLNISENIPVLLESLRLQDRLSEDIEKRLTR